MKKIMILVLSLAVLFGFAACDNSSNTPADDDSVVDTVDYAYVANSLVEGYISNSSTGVSAPFASATTSNNLLSADGTAKTGYTVSADYQTITFSKEISPALGNKPAQTVEVVLHGVNTTAAGTTTPLTITLQSYDYKFTRLLDSSDPTFQTVTGTVSGDLKGSVSVTIADGKATVVNPSIEIVFLPSVDADVDVEYAGNAVVAADFNTYINNGVEYTGSENLTSNKAYYDYNYAEAQDDIEAYVTLLLTGSTEDLASYITANLSTSNALSSTFSQTQGVAAASASVTYELTDDGDETEDGDVVADDGSASLRFAEGTKFTVEFTGTTTTSGSFSATGYTINGTVKAYAATAGATPNTAFDTIVIEGLTGTLSGVTISGADNKISSFTSLDFGTPEITDGKATATVKTAVGPALDGDTLAALGTVVAEY